MRYLIFAMCLTAIETVGVCTVHAKTKSGADWCAKFPDGNDVSQLDNGFRESFKKFKSAVDASGATSNVLSVRRPLERAYLMHWSYLIAKSGQDPQSVPAMDGVDIDWWHGNAASSKQAAQAMVDGYGIDGLGVAPALNSRHTEGKAVDMAVTWSDNLTIKKADGTNVAITSGPRDSTNSDLIEVAKSYSVIHFLNAANDRNHWSTDGH
jgi:hypothetical protein